MAKKKPTAILELNNAFKKNPDRARPNEPKTELLGKPPTYFKAKQKKIWNEIKSNCAEGVLQQSDALAVEALVHLLEEFRDCPRVFQASKMTQMQGILKQLGMTPCARASVVVPKKEDKKSKFKDM
ncbi:MAG: hypothetical protein DWP95_10355 [Proteobacteria bacterium]|nr:MAG: hypothetical protein DWP95_10355 [Pseudomonadota bacterium]